MSKEIDTSNTNDEIQDIRSSISYSDPYPLSDMLIYEIQCSRCGLKITKAAKANYLDKLASGLHTMGWKPSGTSRSMGANFDWYHSVCPICAKEAKELSSE